ncbi:MAG: hypothetical protein BWZ04_00236 [Firmicutes bacterium ADurb.BinA205]|nr:MAG: hypothetical protein BWZ04_00236 [Firmicutes bacterium ADurb.BinA205]
MTNKKMNHLRRVSITTAALMLMTLTSACGKKENKDLSPLMGIDWFTDKETVVESLSTLSLITEREVGKDDNKQYLLDYDNAELFENDCDLTVCCTDHGFVGLNYHDMDRRQTYRQWMDDLTTSYGAPTEQGNGMASWYENPVGKDTAVYLFNLEEGVQVSFYATSNAPDKNYKKERGKADSVYIPTPEIRTPIVPSEEVTDSTAKRDNQSATEIVTDARGNVIETRPVPHSDLRRADVGQTTAVTSNESAETTTVAVETDKDGNIITTEAVTDEDGNVVTTEAAQSTTAVPQTTEPPAIDHTRDFLLNGLSFCNSPNTERPKMNSYSQLYEYRTEEPGQPWELIMEYANVPYMNKNCDAVLCFTSLGLVGVNYFDSNSGNYNYWVRELTNIYGKPNETQYDYTAWSSSPVGNGTMIYVFALEDGVQVSFFADDTGSEMS